MKVRELIAELQKHDPEKEVLVQVGWSDDTATSDEGEPVEVKVDSDGDLVLSGWLSNCRGDLEFVEDGE